MAIRRQLRDIRANLKDQLEVYKLVAKHPKTPRLAKICLALALGYLLLPFDLIPDFIPILGQLDDVVIVPGLVYIAIRLIPRDLIEECRRSYEVSKG